MFSQLTKDRSTILSIIFIIGLAMPAFAQFRIKIPSIKKPSVTKTGPATQANNTNTVSNSNSNVSNRQMVLDDGYTFFDAEPVKKHDSSIRGYKDVGWYLKSHLRLLGTFPSRSAFKIVIKKNGKQLAVTRCEAQFYQKATDHSLTTPMLRRGKDLNFDDFMYLGGYGCGNEESIIKLTGKMDIEIYYIDGDTDEETAVRTYKIDVHRASRVRGSAVKPQPDVAHYYIQRHAEAGVAFVHITGNHTGSDRNGRRNYIFNRPASGDSPGYGQLIAYFSYSPARSTKNFGAPFARCSVNGQRIKLQRDSVSFSSLSKQEYAVYTDRIAKQYKRGSAYRDDMNFRIFMATLPLYSGEGEYSKPPMKIENHPGKWECQIIANGAKLRTLRWEVGTDGNIVPHAEQANGNINLYYKTYLVEMEIPAGGAPFDYRLMPMPNAGLFYGIPWASDEGKAMAGKVPKKGNPFHLPSNKAK